MDSRISHPVCRTYIRMCRNLFLVYKPCKSLDIVNLDYLKTFDKVQHYKISYIIKLVGIRGTVKDTNG